MKSNKLLTVGFFVIFAFPIPISMASWIGTAMALAATGMTDWSEPGMRLMGVISFSAYLLAGTYLVSYAISLILTIKRKALSWVSLLPLFHICACAVLLMIARLVSLVFQIE